MKTTRPDPCPRCGKRYRCVTGMPYIIRCGYCFLALDQTPNGMNTQNEREGTR